MEATVRSTTSCRWCPFTPVCIDRDETAVAAD
jgi:hypothetical protein